MNAVRRYVRAVAMTWLLCQVASLSAFIPEQCCASHAAEEAAKAKAANDTCHETPAPEPKEGDVCPMHRGTPQRAHDCCVMTNACEGPGTHLLSLFAMVGVIEPPPTSSIVLDSEAAFVPAQPPLLRHLSLPDAPPPKH